MGDIRILSASAGSGKTYRLAEELREALLSGAARPEAVVATTFTRKAAAELASRVRTHLLRGDADGRRHPHLAQRLTAARIGTVHSVCHGLVRDFAFELGLSPDLEIVEPGAESGELDPALVDAIAEAVTEPELDALSALVRRFGKRYDGGAYGDAIDWQRDVESILRCARENGLDAEALARSRDRSLAEVAALLGKPARSAKGIDRALAAALADFEAFAETVPHKTAKQLATRFARTRRQLESGEDLPWYEWVHLATRAAKERYKAGAEPLAEVSRAAGEHDRHPRLHEDVRRLVTLVFDIAIRALAAYEERKRRLGVLDYADLERHALRLLARPDLRPRLAAQIDLVLVDEFQDTNPIQLAIFLRLADIAQHSIWVGDQKQSIYGFRGAAPDLMDAVLAQLEASGAPPESLGTSWRSRPELVQLASELFAPAFASHGIPPERVRLVPADRSRAPSRLLGPPVEHWVLQAHPTTAQPALEALARGVRELLQENGDRVEDPHTHEARRPEPRDIGILAYYNGTCTQIAAALRAAGIPATVAEAGLGARPETQVLLAGLALWAAPEDTLAAATLARYLDHPDDPDGWFTRGLDTAGREVFGDQPAVRAIRALRRARPDLGLMAAFDRVSDLLALRDLCRRWGDSEQRLANLEQLRALALAYVSEAATAGTAPTPHGLVAHLRDESEAQAIPPAANAVTVSTWHRAKGLEWPITVLLPEARRPTLFDVLGVHATSDRLEAGQPVDLGDPLGDRWVRYWPYPYAEKRLLEDTPFGQRIAAHPGARAAQAAAWREQLRLLYVACTRARDRLVFVQQGKDLVSGTALELLAPPDETAPWSVALRTGSDQKADPPPHCSVAEIPKGATRLAWAPTPVPLRQRQLTPIPEDATGPDEAARGFARPSPRDYPRAFLAPSALEAAWLDPTARAQIARAVPKAPRRAATRRPSERPAPLPALPGLGLAFGPPEPLGPPLAPDPGDAWDALGLAVHGFLAADRPGLPEAARRDLAARLLAGFEVADALPPEALVTTGDALRTWITHRFPDATWHREIPLLARLPAPPTRASKRRRGATASRPAAAPAPVLRGVVDLLLETPDGLVLVDHKTFRGGLADDPARLGHFALQLAAYAYSLAAAGAPPLLGVYLHLPLLGQMVPLLRI